jgi:hypothetical protein
MMGTGQAWDALDKFYNIGFNKLGSQSLVKGIFVSDCCVLFCDEHLEDNDIERKRNALIHLLRLIKNINIEMINFDYTLTSSIAYGHFKYEKRIVTNTTLKNAIYGNAYLKAYLNSIKPEMRPGQCRLFSGSANPNIETSVNIDIEQILNSELTREETLDLIQRRKYDTSNYYYYWIVNNRELIPSFEDEYKACYKDKTKPDYQQMTTVIQKYANMY